MTYEILIPKTLKIGGYDCSIEYGDEVDKNLRADELTGDYTFLLQRIRIGQYAGEQEVVNVFIHEIIHAIIKIYVAGKIEDYIVEAIANGLHQVLPQLGIKLVIKEV